MTQPPGGSAVADALRVLRERFRASASNTFSAFQALAAQLRDAPNAPEVVEALRRELHRVHGTAGSYGFMDASRLAAKLEERAIRWAADPALDHSARATIIEHFVSALRLAFDAPDPSLEDAATRRRMVVLGLPDTLVTAIRAEGTLRGYDVLSLELGAGVVDAVRARSPHVVVTGASSCGAIVDSTSAAGIPLVALDDRPPGSRAPIRGPREGDVTVIDGDVDPAAIFELSDGLAMRSSWVGATLLVLDDDPSILAIVKYIMERDDVHVITLDDPEQLHDRLTDLAPSLLLMDVNLQGRSGIDMARELRGHAEWRDLPIILFSTETEPAVRELAYQAGADEFLPKPIVPAELRSRIAERLERHRLRRLSEGLHPGTGLPLAARTAREAPVAFLAARHAQAGCSVIVIRPDGDERPAELSVAWLRECQRIARDLTGAGAGGKGGGGFVGYLDGVSVIAVLALSGEDAVARAATLAAQRAADVPPWHAGVAHNGDLTSADLDTVRRAAEYALDSGRHDAGAPVHRWHAESANVAPDVIVVEDDPALSDMVQYALRAAGFSFRAFRTGPEALDGMLAMRTMGRRPLVLLDVDLPGMDGHSLHERLRLERPGIFRVVFVSVHSSEAEQIRALKAGALDYIPKPLSLRVLTAKIPVWLERSRAP